MSQNNPNPDPIDAAAAPEGAPVEEAPQVTEDQRGGVPAEAVTGAEVAELFNEEAQDQPAEGDETPAEVTLRKERRWGDEGEE